MLTVTFNPPRRDTNEPDFNFDISYDENPAVKKARQDWLPQCYYAFTSFKNDDYRPKKSEENDRIELLKWLIDTELTDVNLYFTEDFGSVSILTALANISFNQAMKFVLGTGLISVSLINKN